MKVTIKPSAAPDREIDLTRTLVSAVAAELWHNFGGNDHLNWMEAERFVESLVSGRRAPSQTIEPRPRRSMDGPRRSSRRLIDQERVTGPLPVF